MAKLHFFYSAMNAGKSTGLLQSNHNYKERGMSTILLAPSPHSDASKCTGEVSISSRLGCSEMAHAFLPNHNLLAMVKSLIWGADNELGCVLVDEAQFLTSAQVDQLCEVVDDLEIPVMCYGLRTDYKGEGFEGSQRLLVQADQLTEVKTICHCGRKASMNLRVNERGEVVKGPVESTIVLDKDSFIPLCRKHFKEAYQRGTVEEMVTADVG